MKEANKTKKVMILAALALTLATSQRVMAENTTHTEDNSQETVRDTDGAVVQKDSTSTTTTTEEDKKISKGGLMLEPILFANQEDQTIKSSQIAGASGDNSTSSRGYGAGLRFGGHLSEIFLLGIDARYSRVDTDSSFYSKDGANVYNAAPFIGLQTPLFGIRVLAGYVVYGENNPGAGTSGLDLKFKQASGWRLGAGLHVGAIGLNLEYQDLTYNKTEIESYGQVASNTDTNIDMESKGYGLTVSFPIEL